ncbi:sialidase family protein, partial [Roseisolibacter sp. H3M3-2]|uniref:sialidase family protein n=1 Tax=Roseisolibacter sp. H3M3-2 TaxID=3031323 RepID=UPI0023DB6C5D
IVVSTPWLTERHGYDPTSRCPGSLAWAAGPGEERVAAWWALRPDRGADLMAGRSTDGGRTWDAPARVDTLDRGGAGCERPAPAIAVDAENGYVHLAYSMAAAEGRGVFYAHRMDPRAAFEPPQVIVYGDRPAQTAVASAGERVLVAYEDPNTGGRPFVSLAVSRTAGHTWEQRFAASVGSMSAERPRVRLAGGRVALGWVERAAPREIATTENARTTTLPYPTGVVVRVGTLRE